MKIEIPPRAQPLLRARLLGWFSEHRRALPWRASRDPYRVWVAEIMLQQTRIAAVVPYYNRFLAHFPDFQSLATANEDEVLRLWSGLGYYSRARNLQRAAQEVVSKHSGEFPTLLDDVLALPGIGRYTAAAVLSISYDAPLAVLDGNVARVLARLCAVRGDLREPQRWRVLGQTAQSLLVPHAAGEWNQALMELGETVCTPRNPHCDECPVAKFCRSRTLGLTDRIPAPRRQRLPVKVRIAAAILRDPRGRVLLVRDPGAHDEVLFSRMWQFPAVEVAKHPEKELSAHLARTLGLQSPALEELPRARHGVTYRNVVLLPFVTHLERLPKMARTRVLPLEALASVPVSSATRKIAAAFIRR